MNNLIQKDIKTARGLPRAYIPESLEDWEKFCIKLSRTTIIPPSFQGKPDEIFIACQMGLNIGLDPYQALQGISVINNRPTIWGDAALAVCMGHPAFSDIEETFDFEKQIATCRISRTGKSDTIMTFSLEEATKAGLLEKKGDIWKQYTKRMLQLRARGFAMRDSFPDALKGIFIREEVEDYIIDEKTTLQRPKKETGHIRIVDENSYAEIIDKKIQETDKEVSLLLNKLDSISSSVELREFRTSVINFKGSDAQTSLLKEKYKYKYKELNESKITFGVCNQQMEIKNS